MNKSRRGRRPWLALIAAVALGGEAAAAEVEMPRRNPPGRVSQVVGLTEVAVDFSSPAVRGRAIWGAVVPWGRPWTTGDHPAAHISFGRDVTFGGQPVAAGRYALIAIPDAAWWTIVLNRNAGLGETSADYRTEQDVARVKVAARPAPDRERLAFAFSGFTDEQASLDLEWERVRVSVPITFGTREQVRASIRALDDAWRAYASAARYMLEVKKDYDAGLRYAARSLALARNPENEAIEAALRAAKEGRSAVAAHAPARAQPVPAVTAPVSAAVEPAPAGAEPAPPRPLRAATEPPTFHTASSPAAAVLLDGPERAAPTHVAGARAGGARRGVGSGSPAPSEIAPVIQRGRGDIQGCYQRALRRNPALGGGKLTLSIQVESSGSVRSVVMDSPPPLRAIEPCIKEAVARWSFPLASDEYGAELPIVLQGRE